MVFLNMSGAGWFAPRAQSCGGFSREWTERYVGGSSETPAAFLHRNSILSSDLQGVQWGNPCGGWATWDQTVSEMAVRVAVVGCDAGYSLNAEVRPMIYSGFCAPRVRHIHPAVHADRRNFGRSVGDERENRAAAALLVARDMAALAADHRDEFVFA